MESDQLHVPASFLRYGNQFWSFTISSAAVICMFQDSVPAGSYNDPFLSVCVWTSCVCEEVVCEQVVW